MLVCRFDDPGLDVRIRGAAGPEEPSVFVCTRSHIVEYFHIHYVEVFYTIGCVGVRGSVSREIPCESLLRELIPCADKKIPCSVCVGNSSQSPESADVFEKDFRKKGLIRKIPCVFPCDQGILAVMRP